MDEDNIVIKHLQAVRSDVSEIKERMTRVELRLSTRQQHMGHMISLSGSDRERIESLAGPARAR